MGGVANRHVVYWSFLPSDYKDFSMDLPYLQVYQKVSLNHLMAL